MTGCASWDHNCQAGSTIATGMESVYDSKSPYKVVILNAVIVAALSVYVHYTETSDDIVHWDKIPHYSITWLVFFSVISIMMDIYAKSLKNEKDKIDMQDSAFKTVFWTSAPFYAVIAVCILMILLYAFSQPRI